MINLDLFSDSSTEVAMATKFGQNWQNDLYSAGWHSERGRNGSFDSKIFNGNIVATSCASLIKIGPVTAEIARVTTSPFLDKMAKIDISYQILEIPDRPSPAFQRC